MGSTPSHNRRARDGVAATMVSKPPRCRIPADLTDWSDRRVCFRTMPASLRSPAGSVDRSKPIGFAPSGGREQEGMAVSDRAEIEAIVRAQYEAVRRYCLSRTASPDEADD